MAETVDLIRDYSKEFILRPINEKFEKNEFYFNEKMEKMEKHFIGRIQQLENLIENNNHKTGELDKVIKTLQVNQNKFEGKSELQHETNKKKLKEIELQLNDIKPSKDLTEIEKKFQQLTYTVKQSENQSQIRALSKSIGVDFNKKLDKKLTEVFSQLEIKINEKNLKTRNVLKDEAEKLKKETKQTFKTLTKDMKEKYENCIQHLETNENQTKTKLSEQSQNYNNIRNRLNKTDKNITQVQLKVETTSKAIEELKPNQIKKLKNFGYGTTTLIVCFILFALFYSLYLKAETASMAIEEIRLDGTKQLKKVELETKQTIYTLSKEIKENYEKCIKGRVVNELQLNTTFENNERIMKNDLNEAIEEIAQLQSKIETTSEANENNNSDEIGQLKKVEDETKQTIETFSKDIKDRYDQCIQRHLCNEVQLKAISEKTERNIKNVLSNTTEDIKQLQSKVEITSKAIEELKSDEKVGYGIMQIIVCFISFAVFYSLSLKVKTSSMAIEEQKSDEINVIEERVKEIILNKELEKVIN
ncbi:hypothetical protein CHUAL_000089 [Chamberlinius hualienensis]